MKTTPKILAAVVVVAVITSTLVLVFGGALPASSKTSILASLAAANTPAPLPGAAIPLEPIDDLTSLNATATLTVNGLIDGQRTQGDLNVVLTSNDQGKSRINVTGGLLGDIAAQVGGSLVGLFTPSSVDIYRVPQGTYIVVNALVPVCVKPQAANATQALDDMSPQGLLGMLTGSEVARGRLVGPTTLGGVPVEHYVIDGDAFLAAAQRSSDPKLKAFGDALWSADDADLYVDAEGGYPVAFRGSFSGTYEPLKFEGDLDVQIELTDVNTNTPVNLPSSCNRPISR
jgi:hypothetical protein